MRRQYIKEEQKWKQKSKTKVRNEKNNQKSIKLEYKLEGDFAKYIKKISVKLSDFKFLEKKKGKEKEEEIDNVTYWEAKFIFNKNPTGRGKLIAKFI